jgi:very-short-patch-repair endonuclease
MDSRLLAFAAARGGVLTSAQARGLDVDEWTLRGWRRTGDVVRVRRDAYVLGEAWAGAGPEERLALRTRAVLATRPGDVASHQSALALHRLPLHGVDLTTVDALTEATRVRLASGLRTHPGVDAVAHVVVDGYRCVPVAVAISQLVLRSGLVAALVPLDAALHHGRTDLDAVAAALAATGASARRRDRAARVLTRADARAESPGETLTRTALVDAGLAVRSQVDVHDSSGRLVGRVDLLVGDRVVVEFDGALKYAGAEGRDALVREKRREDALRELGHVVIRVVWADLERPDLLVRRVRRAATGLSASGGVVAAS